MSKFLTKRDREVPTSLVRDFGTSEEDWQVQSAKARFSEVFRRARTEGPQRITRQGKECVVMIAEEQYAQLVGKSHQAEEFWCSFSAASRR